MTPQMIAALVALALSFGGGYWLRNVTAARDLSVVQARHAQDVAAATTEGLRAERQARTEEARRTAAVQEKADAANLKAADARRAAAALDRSAARLREAYVDAFAPGGAAACPAAAGGGSATAGPGLVLTDLLGGADARLRSCAPALDAARIAGLACEQSYDALTATLAERP